MQSKIDWSDGATPTGTARNSRPRRSEERAPRRLESGPWKASPERKSIFSLISKTHHFLLRENDEFLFFVPTSYSIPLRSFFFAALRLCMDAFNNPPKINIIPVKYIQSINMMTLAILP